MTQKKKPSPRLRKNEIRDKIIEFLSLQNKQAFNYKQIAFGTFSTS